MSLLIRSCETPLLFTVYHKYSHSEVPDLGLPVRTRVRVTCRFQPEIESGAGGTNAPL